VDTPLTGCRTWADNETCGVNRTGNGEESKRRHYKWLKNEAAVEINVKSFYKDVACLLKNMNRVVED
ncbi:11945_t:CDS:2, partial [Ambispora leptoticha]